MSQATTFQELIAQVRAGDEQAAEVLFQRYEAQVRRIVRVQLTNPALKRQFDSSDLRQSVLGDFFVRVALGQFELQNAGQLIGLLKKMAENKLLNKVEHHHAARRDTRRLETGQLHDSELAGPAATPSRIAAGRELLAEVRARLTDQERYLAEQRAAGRSWGELAAELGKTADAVRVQLKRALDRVSEELGLSSIDYD